MNKTASTHDHIQRSDQYKKTGIRAQADQKWTAGARLPELDQPRFPLWLPFEVRESDPPAAGFMVTSAMESFQDLQEMSIQFRLEIMQRSWLRAYQLAVAMNLVVVDYLHPGSAVIDRYSHGIQRLPQLVRPVLTEVAGVSYYLRARWNERKRVMVKLMIWQRKAAKLVSELAQVLVGQPALDAYTENRLVADGGTLSAYVPYFPASLRNSVTTLQFNNSSFSHTPQDLSRMVEEFSNLHPEPGRMLTLISVCPPGSYLAPLYAAILKVFGYQEVHIMALSPDKPLNTYEDALLREVTNTNGLVLLCDDPPLSGANMDKTARVLEEAGLKPENTLQLMQLFGDISPFGGPLNQPLLAGSIAEPACVDTRDSEPGLYIGRKHVS